MLSVAIKLLSKITANVTLGGDGDGGTLKCAKRFARLGRSPPSPPNTAPHFRSVPNPHISEGDILIRDLTESDSELELTSKIVAFWFRTRNRTQDVSSLIIRQLG